MYRKSCGKSKKNTIPGFTGKISRGKGINTGKKSKWPGSKGSSKPLLSTK